MATARYAWAAGARSRVPAQVAGNRLDHLLQTKGDIENKTIIDDARNKDSPIHAHFEWNNRKAADLYRIEQAIYLRTNLHIAEGEADKPTLIRAFVRVVVDEETTYQNIIVAYQDDDLRQQIIDRARDELEAWQGRYGAYSEFRPIMKALQKAGIGSSK